MTIRKTRVGCNPAGSLCLCLQEWVEPDDKPWKQWPIPLEEAAEEVLLHISEGTKKKVANSPKGALLLFNDCLGLYIRNNLSLWAYFSGREATEQHPDRISLFIIEALWKRLQQYDCYKGVLRDPKSGIELPEELKNIGIWTATKPSEWAILSDFMQYWKATSHLEQEPAPK